MKSIGLPALVIFLANPWALAGRPTVTPAARAAQRPVPPVGGQHPVQQAGVPHGVPQGGGPRPIPHGPPHIEVLVMDASMGDGGVAPEIAQLRHLHQPPFAGYTQISVVSRTILPLSTQEATQALPDGGTVGVSLVWHGRKGRYSVDCTLTHAGRTSRIQFVASPGEPFFTVRSGRPDHAQVIGFIVRP